MNGDVGTAAKLIAAQHLVLDAVVLIADVHLIIVSVGITVFAAGSAGSFFFAQDFTPETMRTMRMTSTTSAPMSLSHRARWSMVRF